MAEMRIKFSYSFALIHLHQHTSVRTCKFLGWSVSDCGIRTNLRSLGTQASFEGRALFHLMSWGLLVVSVIRVRVRVSEGSKDE